jgi:hypothetical protein
VDYSASAALLNISNLDAVPIQRVPTIMDFNFLPDMGRMNGQWPSEGRTGCLRVRREAPGQLQRCTHSSGRLV